MTIDAPEFLGAKSEAAAASSTTMGHRENASVALKMASAEADEPQFQVVSTNSLQIRVRIPRSPSPLRRLEADNERRAPRASSVRPTRASENRGSDRSKCYSSRSLSPRPPMLSSKDHTRPPPPSPSNSILLPTRAPTPPQKTCDRLLTVPGASSASPRSLSPRYFLS